jgi:uncharacterized membrane protein
VKKQAFSSVAMVEPSGNGIFFFFFSKVKAVQGQGRLEDFIHWRKESLTTDRSAPPSTIPDEP